MLSHKEQILQILKEANLPYQLSSCEDYKESLPDLYDYITLHNTGKLGYNNFCSDWYFDKDGKLLGIANWEE